jgi:hypothetical protein
MTERLRHVPNSRRSPPASNCSKTGLRRQTVEIPVFEISLGKTGLHNRVPVVVLGPGWGKISGKNWHDLRAFGGVYTRCNSAVFWQTGRLWGIFSTGTKKEDNAGFSGSGPGI